MYRAGTILVTHSLAQSTEYEASLALTRILLAPSAFAQAWAEGSKMTAEEIIHYAQNETIGFQ